MSNQDSGNGFWSALFTVSKDDKIMIWLLRVILLVVAISLLISLPLYFYDRSNNRESSQLFGLLTFHPDKPEIKDTTRSFEKENSKHKPDSSEKKLGSSKKEGKNDTVIAAMTQKSPIINGKNVNTGINNGIIGDNGVQNFGIQPRVITEQSEAIQFFLSNYPDKSTRVQFVAPTQEGEIINVKNQIIKILLSKGYSNIENIPGIRLLVDPTTPIDRIGLLHNTSGGITFHIPPSLK